MSNAFGSPYGEVPPTPDAKVALDVVDPDDRHHWFAEPTEPVGRKFTTALFVAQFVFFVALLGPAIIGWLVTLSEGAGAGTLLVLRRTSSSRIRAIVRTGAFVEMAVLAGIAVAPPILAAYAALLILGGTAAGAVTSLAPALVTMVAADQEHGDALALSGTFRSIAMLGVPAAVGAVLGLVALPVAMVAVAALSAAPGVVLGRRGNAAASPPVGA